MLRAGCSYRAPSRKRSIVYTDFEDELGELTAASLRGMDVGCDLTRFEQKVRIYLNTHQDQLAVQKIRRNRQITAVDLAELEKVFVEAGLGTTADIDHVKDASGGLGLFLRSLTGLEREAAALAFDAFQQGKTLTANQLRFVNELIDYLAHNGTIDVAALYEPPFTTLAPTGPEALFPEAGVVDAMVTVIHSIRSTAVAAEGAA